VAGPSWLAGILAAVMIATAVYCVSRLIIARAAHRAAERDVDLVHAAMAVAMAGMLVTRLNPLPNDVWAVLFGGATAWFGWRIVRARRSDRAQPGTYGDPHGHHVPHLVMCGAMVYMLLAVAVVKSGSLASRAAMGSPGAHFPPLALVLALFMFGYVMWQADRLPALARAGIPEVARLTANASGGSLTQTGLPAAPAQVATGETPSTAVAATAEDRAPGTPPAIGRPLSPRLAACCQIAMGITMGYMLTMMV
jgi:hypothetical protein